MRNTCIKMIHELAKKDPRVIFIASDVSPNFLDEMKQEFPDRYFMEGISEGHIISMAAGMAMEGFIPFVIGIGAFITRRCYEQIALDICLHNLPVKIVGIGCGLNYAALGPTHQAIEDISLMRSLPNMSIVAPCDADEMKRVMQHILDWQTPTYIRTAKGFDPIISKEEKGFELGKAIVMREAEEKRKKVLMISTGVMTTRALQAAEVLAGEGIECTILHVHTIKPLDEETIVRYARNHNIIITIEEHIKTGGLGSACVEVLSQYFANKIFPKVIRLGIPDRFMDDYGTQDYLMEKIGIGAPQIAETIKHNLKE